MNLFILAILAIVFLFLIKKANKNTKEIVINRIKINSEVSSPTITILQLSDLHLENISITADELYHKLKEETIDLIALTGDFLDRKRTIPKLIPYLQKLKELKPTYGIYAVLGNHDYVLRNNDLTKLIELLEAHDVTVMQNENHVISIADRPLTIIGIDDFSTKRSLLSKSYEGVEAGPNLVLTHDPNVVLHMDQFHFDYLLAGHFHGGQICYPKAYHLVKMGKLARMNIVKGLHYHQDKPFYINEGLGQTGVNIRVGSRPEITLHEFTFPIEGKVTTRVKKEAV